MAVVEEPDYAALLSAYVEDYDGAGDDSTIERAASVAKEAVMKLVGTSSVPADVVTEAILRTGSSIFHRRTMRSGIMTFGNLETGSAGMRVTKDDLSEARTLLANWLGPGIA